LTTTGVDIGRRRFRSAEPSSQASFVVKCSNTKEESILDIDSSCKDFISFNSFQLRFATHISRRWLYRPWSIWSLPIRHIDRVVLWYRPYSRVPIDKACRLQRRDPLWRRWGCSIKAQRAFLFLPIRRVPARFFQDLEDDRQLVFSRPFEVCTLSSIQQPVALGIIVLVVSDVKTSRVVRFVTTVH
jgi:hypothetical protein